MGKIDILKIARIAQEQKKLDPTIIDATIGMFYNDERKLIIPMVEEAFHQLNVFETFKYGATDGGKIFEDNVISWVLDEKLELLKEKYLITGLSTPGGSGALSLIFNSYGKPGEKVLVSDLRWRYDYFIKSAKMDVHEHRLFLNGAFDLVDLEKQLTMLSKNQKRIIFVLNDPCHNPTGYQLSDVEWKGLIYILNKFTQNEIILAYDIAYFDYNPLGFKEARKPFEYLLKLKSHVQVLICFSASKSFAIYGVRLGGLIGLHPTEEGYKYFKKFVVDDALGKWSTAPSVGVGIFNALSTKKDQYIEELNKLTHTLKVRGDIFVEEAKNAQLNIYPYSGGFFVLVHSKDPERDYELLVQKGIYLIPMETGLRIAICGITTNEVYGLAAKIKKIIGESND